MRHFECVPATEVPAHALHQAFVAAFSDYLIGPFELPLSQWDAFLARQGAQLADSRVAREGADILGFALAAPRPDIGHWRLATMGAPPAARGSGAAAALLDDFIVRAQAAGMAGVELECFAQNTRAQRLYTSRGFAPLHALHGYLMPARAQPPVPHTAAAVPLADAFAWLDAVSRARADLPLQVTPRSLAALPVALKAWRLGSAQLVFAQADATQLNIHSLVDTDPAQHHAEALAAQLLAAFPRQRISVPQLQRPDLGGEALQRLGFARQALHQVLMRRPVELA